MKKIMISCGLLTGLFFSAQQADSTKSAKSLEEVIITKKVFQKKSDRLVYDVAASPIAKGNTAFNLLKETPLVSSTDDKTLKIAGKNNAVIYIDGRRSRMNADALEAFLKNTPAENIAKIEVITLPGSEFDVESSEGVINIILKKKTSDGTNGNLRLSNSQTKYNSQAASGSINYRKGKFGTNASLSYSDNIRPQDYVLMNGNATSSNTSVGMVENESRNLGGYVNLDYALTDKQSLGLSYNFWAGRSPYQLSDFFNTVHFLDENNQWQTTYNRSRNNGKENSRNHSFNLNYEAKLDDNGSRLNLNGAYLRYDKSETNTNIAENVTAQNALINLASQFNQSTPQKVDNFSGTADFAKMFDGFTLGAGGNFNKTKTDNDTYFEKLNLNTGQFEKDENQSNHFVYDEKIGGLYLNLEKTFAEKVSAKIGARMEFTNSYGEILGTDINVSRKNTDFLPSASVNYNINNNNSLSYAFTSRVRRPSFWEINPVRVYLTPVNYIQNNPFMKASSVYNNELMYMYKNAYFLQVQNSFTKDAITQVPLQKTEDGVNTLRYIRTNYGTENNFALNIGMNKAFFKQIWTANYVVGLQVNSFNGAVDTDPITNEKFEPFVFDYTRATPFLQLNNNVRLSSKKDWYLGINYFYLGTSRADLGTLEPLQSLDLSLKKMWNNWTFALDLRDVLKTMRIKIYDLQDSGNFNSVDQYQYSRRATLSLTYNFGNQKLQKVRKMDSAVDDIKSRTGN